MPVLGVPDATPPLPVGRTRSLPVLCASSTPVGRVDHSRFSVAFCHSPLPQLLSFHEPQAEELDALPSCHEEALFSVCHVSGIFQVSYVFQFTPAASDSFGKDGASPAHEV